MNSTARKAVKIAGCSILTLGVLGCVSFFAAGTTKKASGKVPEDPYLSIVSDETNDLINAKVKELAEQGAISVEYNGSDMANVTSGHKKDAVANKVAGDAVSANKSEFEKKSRISSTVTDKSKVAEVFENRTSFEQSFENKVIVNSALTTDRVKVYASPDMNSDIVGSMYVGCAGNIIFADYEGGWYEIASGSVEGWVRMEEVLTSLEGAREAELVGYHSVQVVTDEAYLRDIPSYEDGAVMETVYKGKLLAYVSSDNDWVTIQYDENRVAYIDTASVEQTFQLGTAISTEEEYNASVVAAEESEKNAIQAAKAQEAYQEEQENLIAAAQAAAAAEQHAEEVAAAQAAAEAAAQAEAAARAQAEAEAAAAAAAQAQAAAAAAQAAAAANDQEAWVRANIDASVAKGQSSRGPLYLSYADVYLMACVCDMEALSEPYEGKLAVANVIINRYYSDYWNHDIHSVVYAPGQFTGVGTGEINQWLAQGPSSGSWQAAFDACAGINNVGGYLFFCSRRRFAPETYSSYIWVANQCFYAR